jgi:hypothetical protein
MFLVYFKTNNVKHIRSFSDINMATTFQYLLSIEGVNSDLIQRFIFKVFED